MIYYNDNDAFCCRWLQNLMTAGHIGQGTVDERSIHEIKPEDVAGFTRCHFFAGIAGWELALQWAGWPSDAPVWTGSCPCQPLSAAGKRKGHEDERHLWPVWFSLIEQCRPPVVIGEQVASKDGREWLCGVRADLETVGYAFGAADLCAAGVGAPHIRQRLFWVGFSDSTGLQPRSETSTTDGHRYSVIPASSYGGLDNSDGSRTGCADASVEGGNGQDNGLPWTASPDGGLADTMPAGRAEGRAEPRRGLAADCGATERPADAELPDRRTEQGDDGRVGNAARGRFEQQRHDSQPAGQARPEPERTGAWDDSVWLPCSDGKWRRVPGALSGIRPLAPRLPGRVGQLRAYGNSIVPQVAAEFVRAVMNVSTYRD